MRRSASDKMPHVQQQKLRGDVNKLCNVAFRNSLT